MTTTAQVNFIADQSYLHVLVRVLADLAKPVRTVLECRSVSDVVDKESTDGESIVHCRDLQELLSARSVPDLSSNSLISARQRKSLNFKLNAVRSLRCLFIISLREAKQ